MSNQHKRVDARVQSNAEKLQITITGFDSTPLAVVSAYDALENAVHMYLKLPKRPLSELVGYLRGTLGIQQTMATVHPETTPPGACL